MEDIPLSDPEQSLLLRVDMFVFQQGWLIGTSGSSRAFETEFGLVLVGCLDTLHSNHVASHHVSR